MSHVTKLDILYGYLEGSPAKTLAKKFGLGLRAIGHILREPEIRAERDRLVALMLKDRSERLELLVPTAIDTLRDVMSGQNESELQMKAAVKVLEHARSMQHESGQGDVVKDLGAAIIRELSKQVTVQVAPKIERVIEIHAEEVSEPVRSDK